MNRFSKLVESQELKSFFKVEAQIDLAIIAENEGAAGYIADSELASIESQSDFRILNISTITKDEYNKLMLIESIDNYSKEMSIEEKIQTIWDDNFADNSPNEFQKMEFYHQMRESGFEGQIILKVFKNKIK